MGPGQVESAGSGDLAVVDALARLLLAAERAGVTITVRCPDRIRELAGWAGLGERLTGFLDQLPVVCENDPSVSTTR